MIISDDQNGMEAVRKAVFKFMPWQSRKFHLLQNAQAYVSKVGILRGAKDIRTIFNALDQETVEVYLKKLILSKR